MQQSMLADRVESFLKGEQGLANDPAEVLSSINQLDEEGLQRFDYGFYLLNILSVYGKTFSREAAASLAIRSARSRILSNWESARHFAAIDQDSSTALALDGWIPSQIESALNRGKGLIICTAHLGAFRLLPADLSLMGFDATMAIDSRSAGCYSRLLEARASRRNATSNGGSVGTLTICDVERESRTTLILFERLRRNGIVMFWFDGNIGLDGRLGHDNRHDITFLGRDIAVKCGFAELAALTDSTVLPVLIPKMESGKGRLCWGRPVNISETNCVSPREFAKRTTEQLYANLERYIHRFPAQWESMRFLHRWRVLATKGSPSQATTTCPPSPVLENAAVRLRSNSIVVIPHDSSIVVIDVERLKAITLPREMEPLVHRLLEREGLIPTANSFLTAAASDVAKVSTLLKQLGNIGMLEVRAADGPHS